MIKFSKRTNTGLFLLATNDKTIKYWKVHDKRIRRPVNTQAQSGATTQRVGGTNGNSGQQTQSATPITIPQNTTHQTITMATLKRVYANAHTYHINSISINSDGQTFISADDLRVNLWSLDVTDTSFNIIDLKPPNLEELTEVITSAIFHPSSCNMLLYTSSRGTIRLCDLRAGAHAESNTQTYEAEEDPSTRSFFSEIISSISDAKFTSDGRYIISRDYMTLKIWDVNMNNRPLSIIPVHDYLNPHLADLYENDCIFDKFECASSFDSQRYVSGSYNNHFVIYSGLSQSSVMIEALRDAPRPRLSPQQRQQRLQQLNNSKGRMLNQRRDRMLMASPPNVQAMDFAKKALHVAWHPKTNCIAIAGLNKLYIYQAFSMATSADPMGYAGASVSQNAPPYPTAHSPTDSQSQWTSIQQQR
jgi:serine/threonine-protein phosphatase 2A regulatory subunit B